MESENSIKTNQFKLSGWAFSIYGIMTTIGFLLWYSQLVTLISTDNSSLFSMLPIVMFNVFFGISFLTFLVGIYLLKNTSVVHKVALPLSFLLLLSLPPLGTIVGGTYLWQRFKEN